MSFLVDANVLSEATKPDPDPEVLDWLLRHEPEIAVDPVILGEIRFGILLLPAGKRRERLEDWFQVGIGRNAFITRRPRMRSKRTIFWTALLVLAAATLAADPHPFNVHDLVTMNRVSDPQVSPDGTRVAYVVRSTDLEADRGRTDLYLVGVEGSAPPRRITTHEAGDSNPRWSVDGKSLYFLSTRSGSPQVWRLPTDGGESQQVTDLPLDASNLTLSPDGEHMAVSIEVFIDCETLQCTADRLDEREAAQATGRVYDQLFIRHWDTWSDGRRSHLFVLPLDGGEPRDLTAGLDADVPSKPFGGAEEYSFTPDGKTVVFTARTADHEEPWSTDFNLFAVPTDGSAEPRQLTENPAWDTQPVFSPDGKTLAYLAMSRPAYESDRFRIHLRSWADGSERVLAEDWDRSAGSLLFSADGKTLYVTATADGEVPVFAIDVASGAVKRVAAGGRLASPALAGEEIVFSREHLKSPADLWAVAAGGGEPRRLTEHNRERLDEIAFGDYERLRFKGWNGATVSGWVVKPVGFEAGKKYPIAFLIHGGPQGSWTDRFHYRWNAQIYAGAGYGAVLVDFHGSTGYGQAFTDSIRGDWGGKPLEDLRKGFAAALKGNDWLDAERACALGASYGGYMVNWIAGNWTEPWKCLVNHDGLFDLRSMYFATEELWFPEWDLEGTPWTNPEGYSRHNPAEHVEEWRVPMLVVHGEQDYRVPVTQGFQTFTALKRRGVPSRLLYYPDESHFVLKPSNSVQWHETVLAWLERWAAE